jgi:hypothetical protein
VINSDGEKVVAVRAKRIVTNIAITGQRDPRGPDNNIRVWIDNKDQLHIQVLKAERCYFFKKMINDNGYVEIIQA